MHEESIVYSIGDRVELLMDNPDHNDELVQGTTGTVCNEDRGGEYWVPIRWDIMTRKGHDCDGECENGYGWNVPREYIMLVSQEIDDADIADIMEIQTMLGVGGVKNGS